MKAKIFLQEIKKLDKKIENKQMQIKSLYDLIQNITAPIKDINVQTSGNGDAIGNAIVKIVDLQNEINAQIDEYVNRKLEAIRLINMLDNDEYINILFRRYVKYEEWQVIARELHYSRQAIDKKHGLALLEFEKVLES